MSMKSVIAVAVRIILTGASLLVESAHIAPNPNPAASTIDIINDPFAVNNASPFANAGTINIHSASTVTNARALINSGTLFNTDGLTNAGYLNDRGVGTNTGTLTNDPSGVLTNVGMMMNQAGVGMKTTQTMNNNGTPTNAVGGTLIYGGGRVTTQYTTAAR